MIRFLLGLALMASAVVVVAVFGSAVAQINGGGAKDGIGGPKDSVVGRSPTLKVPSRVTGIVMKVLVKSGQRVQRGQVLMQLDDRIAKVDLQIAKNRVLAAEAQLRAVEATVSEAKVQYERLAKLQKQNPGVVSKDEIRLKKLTTLRYQYELQAHRAAISIARLEEDQASLRLNEFTIHSPVSGTVSRVTRMPGEAVRELDTAVYLRIARQ